MDEEKQIESIIRRALDEDIGSGDITTECTVPAGVVLKGRFLAKTDGVIAGLELSHRIFSILNSGLNLRFSFSDADLIHKGDCIGTIQGSGRTILTAERVVLNFMQRMSGIATLTRHFVDAVKHTSAVILDTRKTAPGLRVIDKWAVRLGGGQNHRTGLYDMALIKENHITAAGSLSRAVSAVRDRYKTSRKIEVEVRNLIELREALELPVDMIMLDNFSLEELREAVNICAGKIPLEASGNVNLDTVTAISETGVDFISVGMLTHSVEALDISLIIDD
jgi:nicotinate-nucleotide pyrophosphorylase (carboxylating)